MFHVSEEKLFCFGIMQPELIRLKLFWYLQFFSNSTLEYCYLQTADGELFDKYFI